MSGCAMNVHWASSLLNWTNVPFCLEVISILLFTSDDMEELLWHSWGWEVDKYLQRLQIALALILNSVQENCADTFLA